MLIIRTGQEANVASESDHIGPDTYLKKIQLCLHCGGTVFLSEFIESALMAPVFPFSHSWPQHTASLRVALPLSWALYSLE